MIEEARIGPPRDDESDLLAGPAAREDIGLDEIDETEEDEFDEEEGDEDFDEEEDDEED